MTAIDRCVSPSLKDVYYFEGRTSGIIYMYIYF